MAPTALCATKTDKTRPSVVYKFKSVWAALSDVPIRVKAVLVLGVLYLLNPIDIIPDFIPVIGHLDDVLIVGLVAKYVKKHAPDFDIKAILLNL